MNNLANYIEYFAQQKPETPFIIHGDYIITYKKAAVQIQSLSHHLEKSGLKPGQTVGILLQNCPEFIISYLSIMNIGAVAALLPWTMPETEVATLATTTRIEALIYSQEFQNHADHIRNLSSHQLKYFVHGKETDHEAVNIYDYIHDSVQFERHNPLKLKNNAVILFSAGDYTHPKSLVFTSENLILTSQAIHDRFPINYRFNFYTSLPFFHFFPFSLVLNLAIFTGNTLVLPFDDSRDALYTSIEKHKINTFVSNSGFIQELVSEKYLGPDKLKSIDFFIPVGDSFTIETKNIIFQRYSARVVEAYGVAEAPVITMNMNTNDLRSMTVGKPISCCDISIVDDNGNELPENKPGNLMVRGANVFHHYFDQYPINDRNYTDWVSTGDVVQKDADGYIYWLCKQADRFYRNGFQEIPNTVTDIISQHPKVREVTLLVSNGKYYHDSITAAVILNEPLTDNELNDYCKEKLPKYLIPDSIEIVDHFDRNCIGIIKKSHVKST